MAARRGWLEGRGGADDRRKIVANDGEVKAASSSFSLPAFVLLGVPTTAQGRYSYRADGAAKKKVDAKNVSFC